MKNQQESDAWSKYLRWEGAFEILSLERAEPFFPDMGLQLSKVEPVRSLARQFIEKLDTLPDDTLAARTALLQEHLARFADVTDRETTDRIYHWATEIVSLGNPGHQLGWLWILRWLAGVRGRDTPLVKPNIDSNKLEAVIRAIHDHFEDELDLDDRIDQAEALPKSDWDTKIYARNAVGYSQLTTVSNAATEYRFRRAWAEIEELLSNEEIDELVRWAKSQAPKLNLRPELLERPQL